MQWPSELKQKFDLVVFDWDGTAVLDRSDPALELPTALSDLLRLGTLCVIVTGTNVENVVRQLGVAAFHNENRIFACTNRGSEVFTFSEKGEPICLYRRQATIVENEQLDRSIKKFQHELERYKLATEIISNRLNRRKLDLIPTTRWRDPRKAEFAELFEDLKSRLATHSIDNGLSGCMSLAFQIAQSEQLENPRITTDIKHIEIGLTDKSDSVIWVYQNLILPKEIPQERIVIFGDEFGPLGNVKGSDSLMRIKAIENCLFVSVGVEPQGTPNWVHPIGGGPRRFIEFLREQYRLILSSPLLQPIADTAWVIEQEGFDPSREREMESLFTIGNGFVGVRGALDLPIPASQGDLFLAGVYDRKASILPYSEPSFHTQADRNSAYAELVPFPSPFSLCIEVDGSEIEMLPSFIKCHSRILDLKQGAYFENYIFELENSRRVSVKTIRASLLHKTDILLQEIEVSFENFAGSLRVAERECSAELIAEYPHLERVGKSVSLDAVSRVSFRTRTSAMQVWLASRWFMNQRIVGEGTPVNLEVGQSIRIQRYVAIDHTIEQPITSQTTKVVIQGVDLETCYFLIREHVAAWNAYWQKADFDFYRNHQYAQSLRFNLYHLRIAAGQNPKTSIGARALTGRAYEGHIFWDSEIFVFPFLLNIETKLAENILRYRYETLAGAKLSAKNMKCEGACYSWESTLTGEDETPRSIVVRNGIGEKKVPVFTGTEEIHITADVAFAAWQFWKLTQNQEFLWSYAFEILAETAKFWSSRVSWDQNSFHILDVVGPDEYHHHVRDNAYTNWMARFNLDRAVEAAQILRATSPSRWGELATRIQVTDKDIMRWREVSENLFIPRPNSNGIIEQFTGYFDLQDVKIDQADRIRTPVSRLFSWDQVNKSKVIKQADVLMIPFLFPEAMSAKEIRANYIYYEPKTDHGSSLSLPVHAAIARRAGFLEQAKEFWEQSVNFDLKNLMGNTALGVHIGCMGATWQALVLHILANSEDAEPIVPVKARSVA